MTISSYPYGFAGGTSIRNMPVLNCYSGDVYWVDNTVGAGGSDGNDGAFQRPLASLQGAINRCVADHGDLIMVKAGHAETLTASGAIAMDVAGVRVIGMGVGRNRPVLTFTPASTSVSNVIISAANTSIQNIVCEPGLSGLTQPISITASNTYLDIEWEDVSASSGAATVILTTAAADHLYICLAYSGFDNSTTCVAPIQLVGCNGAQIELNFYGKASTAAVEFITTASTDINVTGAIYNATDTTGAKLVVDTITGSTWYASVSAGAAGGTFAGGSAAAMASTAGATPVVPTADSTANANIADVIGNKSDAAVLPGNYSPYVGGTASVMGALKALGWLAQSGSSSVISTVFSTMPLANGNHGCFMSQGPVMMRILVYTDSALTSTGGTGTLSIIDYLGNTVLPVTAVDGVNFQTGHWWAGAATTTTSGILAFDGSWTLWYDVTNPLYLRVATGALTAGRITVYMQYIALQQPEVVPPAAYSI